jgi:hypothetical protein
MNFLLFLTSISLSFGLHLPVSEGISFPVQFMIHHSWNEAKLDSTFWFRREFFFSLEFLTLVRRDLPL